MTLGSEVVTAAMPISKAVVRNPEPRWKEWKFCFCRTAQKLTVLSCASWHREGSAWACGEHADCHNRHAPSEPEPSQLWGAKDRGHRALGVGGL